MCSVTIVSSSAGTVIVHATTTFSVGGISLTRETDAQGLNSGNAVKVFVDAFITISPPFAENEVNTPHTITATVKQDDGRAAGDLGGDLVTGFGPAPDGTRVDFTLPTNTAGATFVGDADFCYTSDGICSVTIVSSSAGTVEIHATTTFFVGTVELTRETDAQGFNSGNAVKIFVDAFIALSPIQAANEVNAEHVITATVMQDDGRAAGDLGGDGVTGFGAAPDGTVVSFSFLVNTDGAVFLGGIDSCTTSGGSCAVTITATTAGSVEIQATTTFFVGGIELTRTTGTGGQNSENAGKIFVDAKILIGPDDVNGITESHTFTVQVSVDYGGGVGPQAVPDGTIPTVSLSDSGGAVNSISSNTCADIGTTGGLCSVTFTSNTAGTVTGHASVTLDVLGVTLTRETDHTHGSSGDAVKVFIAGSIVWHKIDNAGRPLGGATFEVCQTKRLDTSTDPDTLVDITPVCISVVDDTDGVAGGTLDEDPAPGEFSLSGLVLGEYTVQESIAPPGYIKDPRTQTVDLTLENPTVEITEPFRDARPSLKLTSFGYTNTPNGPPADGVVSGTAVYSFTVTNFGGADALLDLTFVVSVPGGAGSGTVTYGGSTGPGGATEPLVGDDCVASGCTVSWSGVAVASGATVSFSVTIVYDHAADGTRIQADLGATYTVDPSDGVIRTVSGSPATIIFTVQAD
jgi:hypothetical protein